MIRKPYLAAILSAVGISAHAQSSVTLYGIVDAGLTYVNHTATSTGTSASALRFGNGVAQASRWGLKGDEDLGGGLKAVFVLENGFNVGDGTLQQGGAMFGRSAFVGLSKAGVGKLTFGRQFSLSTDYIGAYSMGVASAVGNLGFHINLVDQEASSLFNNSVKFSSANFGGLTFGAMYGFSTLAGAFGGAAPTTTPASAGSARTYSFGANYDNGRFGMGAAYTNIDYPTAGVPPSTITIANVSTNGVRALTTYAVGAHYVEGRATVFGNVSNTRFFPLSGKSSAVRSYEIGANYFITSTLNAALGYFHSTLNGAVHGRWNQINSDIDYLLSKRTDTYVAVVYQDASGSNMVGGKAVPVQAEVGAASMFVGNSGSGATSQLVVRIGIRHKF